MRRKRKNVKYYDTGIELKVEAALKKLKVEYVKQHWIEQIAPVDFYLPEHNLIIEADGCFWHGCPTHHPTKHKRKQAHDIIRNYLYAELGYSVLRIWEHDINNMTLKKLSNFISNEL